jgi:phosphatidylglycerol---prolipoprotein diacylglyceryl transferase
MSFLVIPFPVINPVAIDIGPLPFGLGSLPLRWYALAYIGGFVAAWAYMRFIVARDAFWAKDQRRPSRLQVDDLIVYVAFGVILGGRLGHVLFYDFGHFLRHPLDVVMLWKGGMSFHGGFIGAAVGMALFARAEHLPLLTTGDICAIAAPIGLFLGRLANFIKPELWGRPTDVPWAMVFPDPAAGELPRHPSQLYEAGLEGLALGLILWIALRAGALKRPGLATGIFCLGYALARSFCEFFREPDPDQEALSNGWTMGIALSLPMAIAGLALIGLALRRRSALA